MAEAAEQEYVDALCKQLYESTDERERAAAERALAEFSERADCLRKCLQMLEADSAASSYAQLVASTTLLKLVSRQSSAVTLQERVELHSYVLNYLVSRPKLPAFVVTSLCQLFARLTKLGWFEFVKSDEYVFRVSLGNVFKLAQGSMDLCALAVNVLGHLVAEMNQPSALGSITKHRKVAASFRDAQLFEIFQLSVSMLQTALDNIKSINSTQLTLISGLLQLAANCLTFDFIGSLIDDTSDDNANVQVPTTWRVAFVDSSIVKLFFGLFGSLSADQSAKCLTCLVQLASVRRTIFNNAERQQFLSSLASGIAGILENPQTLSDQTSYHEFCRLVARLKSNYQLSELVRVEDYPKLIRMLAEFTVTSLQLYQFAANSIHYLLSFWQRMVSSMPYVKAAEPHHLEEYAPLIAKAFIESRVNLVASVLREGLEDPLEDATALAQQMEQLSVIGRCDYERTCALIVALFDASAGAFETALRDGDAAEQRLHEARLTWLVFIIGAAIGGRVAFSTVEEHDLIDGDLICRALQLMRLTDARLPDAGNEKTELAYLWHLEQFRKIYISDQVQRASKVYQKLAEVMGLGDEASVLAAFVRKVITNLKYWSGSERLVDDTLSLLNDLSIGYASVRKLVRLPEMQYLLNNHTSEHFSLLGTGADLKTMKSRSTFYTALTRLLCVELSDEDDLFDRFVQPLTDSMNDLSKIFTMADASIQAQEETKRAVVGLTRDIRGIAYALNTKTTFCMLFDWLYPNFTEIMRRAIEIWYANPEVTTPVLKLMNELCQNRSQRLQFDMASPNAILLFKESSKLLCTYGSRVTTVTDISKEEMYARRLKGVGLCFGILKAALSGSYVNFGVFRLYGDSCLDDALNMFVKLLLSIPQGEMLAYSKLSQNYYYLLECLVQDHLVFVSNLDEQIFIYLLQSLHDGLTALDAMVCTGCCSTLDHLLSYLYRRIVKRGRLHRAHAGLPAEGDNCIRALERNPQILQTMLSTVLSAVMFEECRCQWSMSRPLLALILLQEEQFGRLKQQLVRTQPSDKQPPLEQCFSKLMDGVERNLAVKNKDRFTQNLSVFRREVSECLKGASLGQTPGYAPADMMY